MTQQLKCCVPYTVISCILFYVLGVIQVTYDCQYLMFLKIDVDIFSVHLLLSCSICMTIQCVSWRLVLDVAWPTVLANLFK